MNENIEEKITQTKALEVVSKGMETEASTQLSEETAVSEQPVMEQDKEQPQNVVVNIDYDKLTEAIIKAQEKMIVAKRDEHLNGIASIFSYVLSIAEVGFAILILTSMALGIRAMDWSRWEFVLGNIISLALYALLMCVVGFVAYWTWAMAKKLKTEQDRNFTVSVFSSFASFAALVVAGVSLLMMLRS